MKRYSEQEGRVVRTYLRDLRGVSMGHVDGITDEIDETMGGDRIFRTRHKTSLAKRLRHVNDSVFSRQDILDHPLHRATQMLNYLTNVQRESELESDIIEGDYPLLLESYFRSEEFRSVLLERQRLLRTAQPPSEINKEFVGRVFEDLGFLSLSSGLSINPSLTLLSASRSDKLTQQLFPSPVITNRNFGRVTVNNFGAYNPDGYVVEETAEGKKVAGVVEYSLVKRGEKFSKQYGSFSRMKKDIPSILGEARFILVFPIGTEIVNFRPENYSDVRVVEIGISRLELSNYFNQVLLNRPDGVFKHVPELLSPRAEI